MATTDQCVEAQRPLAELAWSLREKYKLNRGMNKNEFLIWYNLGEVQLSTVYENLFVETRNKLGKPTLKESADRYDFIKVFPTQKRILGDMKTCVLQKNDRQRRFVVGSVENKIGNIYIVGWNWMTKQPNFFAIPPDDYKSHPKAGYKIPVHPMTGERTSGWYNDNCAYDTWEEMVEFG
jgi:hypothetical protein